jgi:hypothetical protein
MVRVAACKNRRSRSGYRHNDVGIELRCASSLAIARIRSMLPLPQIVYLNVAPVGPTQLVESLSERSSLALNC